MFSSSIALRRALSEHTLELLLTFSLALLLILCSSPRRLSVQRKMAEASAADGQMKDLKISETKKKKDGNPQKAAKKPQQPKKKVGILSYTKGTAC